MAFVYILYSEKWKRYYVGSTPNIDHRLLEHNSGITLSTKNGRPWILVFAHQASTLIQARQIEYKIKTWKSRKNIEDIVREQRLRIG